jgi:hypothetical protein
VSRTESLQHLVQLNLAIGQKEDAGDREWFDALLAPAFAMRRANGAFVGRDEFLASLQKADTVRTTEIVGVEAIGQFRSEVRCIVSIANKKYDNLRLFVHDGKAWLLVSWVNENLG